MKRTPLFVWAAVITGACSLVTSLHAQPVFIGGPPEVVAHRINPNVVSGAQPPAGGTSALSPITNHGGSILSTPDVYIIWYGNWTHTTGSDTPSGQQIVRDFLHNVGGSPYYKINTTYGASGNVTTFSGEASDSYSQGTRLSDSKVQAVVTTAINGGKLPFDSNGLYFVLTSSDVTENTGFCSRYCGWHTHASISGLGDLKYSFVGNPNRCLNACAMQSSVSPNGNPGVDGMVSVIAHELEETNTDPDLNAWFDSSGAENADKCAWTFGNTYQIPTGQPNAGAWYNIQLSVGTGTKHYLIQRNLDHMTTSTATVTAGDYCAMSLNADGSPSQ
jgi:hypothetical protein